MIRQKIEKLIREALSSLGIEEVSFTVEHPAELDKGDYATNVALVAFKKIINSQDQVFRHKFYQKASKGDSVTPVKVAEILKEEIDKKIDDDILKVEVAGPGFINFYLSKEFYKKSISEILDKGNEFGKGDKNKGKKILYEYTDPNPFKVFHIGHLMANTIGEAFSRLAEWNGAEVKRMCYGGDVGLHIGKTIWGMTQNKNAFPHEDDRLTDKVKFVGASYVTGNNAYDADPKAKAEITEINKKIFEYLSGNSVDEDIEVCYKKGKEWSIKLFHQMYDFLGTKFDYEVFESEVAEVGKKIVLEAKEKGVFQGDGNLTIFAGESAGLHTRVFINSEGLPTYEAKEVGLAINKFKIESWDSSVVITGNEQKDYYRVILEVLKRIADKDIIDKKIPENTKNFTHGMMKFASGKMSSRKGNVIAADEFIEEIKTDVAEKIKDRDYDENTNEEVKNKVALSAFKYIILRQSPGKDVIYDNNQAISFEGDSGPYLQYAVTRAHSVLHKADMQNITLAVTADDFETTNLEKMLYRFPEVVERAGEDFAPQLITTYLTELAGVFNSWYGNYVIVSQEDNSPYRVALTKAFTHVMQNGLNILAIPVPGKM